MSNETNQLVITENGEARTTSLLIAEGLEVEHASIIKLVRTYQPDLEEFGLVGFEIAPRPKGQHGGGDVEFAKLNEQQSTLIMTFAKNTEVARTFKKRLVKAFYELAQQYSKSHISYRKTNNPATTNFKSYYGIAKLIGLDKNQAAIAANNAARQLTGTDVLALMGTTHLLADVQEITLTPTEIGKQIGKSAIEINKILAEKGFQQKTGNQWEATETGKPFSRLFDTGKKHSNGVPVTQVKWFSSIIPEISQ